MPTNTSGGTTTSFFNTPQATDNCYTADEDCVYYFDVMSDDLGGSAKVLWSIDDNNLYGTTTTSADGATTTTTNVDSVIDLTVKDAAGCVEKSALGASISIVDGKVKYDARALDWLAEGQTATDYFTYAIRLSNGTLSWATVTITITGTNDGPDIKLLTGDSASAAIAETNAGLTANGTLTVFDADTNDSVNIAVSSVNVGGTGGSGGLTNAQLLTMLSLTANNANAANGAQGSLGWIFNSAGQAFDNLAAGQTLVLTYTLTGDDGHGGTDTQNVTVTVTGTNDGPVAVADTAAGTENQVLTVDVLANDTDVDDGHAFTLLSASAPSGQGTASVVGNQLRFDPGADFDHLAAGATATVTIGYTMEDEHHAQSSATLTVTVTGTNDGPVLTGDLAAPINEGGTYQLTTADLNFTDPDDGAANVTFTVTGLTNGTLYVNGVAGNTFTGAQLASGLVTFQHDGSETLTAGFQVSVEDGNEDLSAPVAQAFNFTVTAANDAPVNGVPGAQSVNEDNALVFSTPNGNAISISDTDAGAGTVRVTLSAANGALILGSIAGLTFTAGTNGSGSFTIDGTLAAINTALQGLTYQGNLNYFGPDSISIVTSDLGNSGSGGALTDSDSIAITVNAVNDAPVASPVTLVAIAEDSGARIITQADLLVGVTDVDGPPATITALSVATGNGALISNGNGTWTYTPALNDDTSVTFNYTASDGSLSSSSTATLDITPVNDAPVNATPAGTQSATAGSALAIGGVSVSDVDSATLTTTLSVQHGALSVTAGGGATIGGNGTGSVTLSGTQAQINAALAGLTYTATAGYSGSDTLSVNTSDGALSDLDNVAISVISGNAGPTANPDVIVVSTGTSVFVPASWLLGNDTDPDGDALSITSLGISGTLPSGWTVTPVTSGGVVTGFNLITSNATNQSISITYTITDGNGHTSSVISQVTTPGQTSGPGQNTISLAGIEYNYSYVDGMAQGDTLTGGTSTPVSLNGSVGNDTFIGSAGNDILDAKGGSNVLTGGAGDDDFILTNWTGMSNHITDFNFGAANTTLDQLQFDVGLGVNEFSVGNNNTNIDGFRLSSTGSTNVAGSELIVNNSTNFADSNAVQSYIDGHSNITQGAFFVVFNSQLGHAGLYYDANPSAAGGAVLIAELDNVLNASGLNGGNVGDFIFA